MEKEEKDLVIRQLVLMERVYKRVLVGDTKTASLLRTIRNRVEHDLITEYTEINKMLERLYVTAKEYPEFFHLVK